MLDIRRATSLIEIAAWPPETHKYLVTLMSWVKRIIDFQPLFSQAIVTVGNRSGHDN